MTAPERKRKQTAFLNVFKHMGNVTASCEAAGVARRTYYSWKKSDDEFRKLLADANEEAADALELEAFTRATSGSRPSDTLLIFLLNGLRPDKFVRRVHHSGKVEGGARVTVLIPDNGRDPKMLPGRDEQVPEDKTVH